MVKPELIPVANALQHKVRSLVSPDASVINAGVYSDPEIYQLELEKIFARSWVLLCPEDQIPNAGDYFVSYIGEDPVIVSRQSDLSIAAFLNQCRHRGGALCRGESGNTKARFSLGRLDTGQFLDCNL